MAAPMQAQRLQQRLGQCCARARFSPSQPAPARWTSAQRFTGAAPPAAGALRPSQALALQASLPRPIATPILVGAGLIGAGLAANFLLKAKSNAAAGPGGKWVKGGFQNKMDKKEAAQVLGLRETALTKARVKDAHRRMMIANHPDRGGAPYLASKINEAKDLLDKQVHR